MLDGAHRLVLRAVAQGRAGADSPALRRLVATGLVEQRPDGTYAVTPSGRIALEHDEPRGWESTAWLQLVLTVGAAALVVAAIVSWLA